MIFEEGDTVLVHKSYVVSFSDLQGLAPKEFNFFTKEFNFFIKEINQSEEYRLYSNKHKAGLLIFIYEENGKPLFKPAKVLLIEKYEF
jgi:hypothetical protein